MTYIIQFKEYLEDNWQRSHNKGKTGAAIGKFLTIYDFATREEAEAEAVEQQKLMGSKYEYRVFPEALDEAEVLDKIKAVLDTPTPKTKLEQIKAILEEI